MVGGWRGEFLVTLGPSGTFIVIDVIVTVIIISIVMIREIPTVSEFERLVSQSECLGLLDWDGTYLIGRVKPTLSTSTRRT